MRSREYAVYAPMINHFLQKDKFGFEWIDLTAPSEKELDEIAVRYQLPEKLVQDCLEPEHLPKYEKLEDLVFIILRVFDTTAQHNASTIHELSRKVAVFIKDDSIITIHRSEQPLLEELKTLFQQKKKCNITDVLFRIIDKSLLSFEDSLNALTEEIDKVESQIFMGKKHTSLLESLYHMKRQATLKKRIIVISRDIIERLDNNPAHMVYMQDLQDTYLKIETLIDQVYENSNSLLHVYLSISTQKTNEVMRVLTIFSVFFMPLTFIVGIYGMNFRFMPELEIPWGYPATMGGMGIITLLIYFWFKRKEWM